MRLGAIALAMLASAMLAGACAAPPKANLTAAHVQSADYRHLTCTGIALEVSRTQRALAAARQRPLGGVETARAAFLPISYGQPSAAQASSLDQRLMDLQRASRAKRCASIALRSATA